MADDLERPPIAYPPPDGPPVDLGPIVSLDDFEAPARARLHPAAYAYIASGAWDEWTLRRNLAAWDAYRLRPRMLVDVGTPDLRTTLLGREVALPVGVAPAALHGLAHADGELVTARAAAAAGMLNVVSTVSSQSLEAIAAAAPDAPRWFQLYTQREPAITHDLVDRARDAGYQAIVLTVDLPVLGSRDAVVRARFDPGADAYGNLPKRDVWRTNFNDVLDQRTSVSGWPVVEALAARTGLPIVVKGILTGEDAALAVDHEAAAVWVSNHGGRQLDRAPAAIEVLEEVVEAVAGRVEVYLDGGVRRGPDVGIALALGARAVFLARPFLYALAAAGEAGLEHAFRIVRDELDRTVSLLGVPSPGAITRAHVALAPERGRR